MFKTMRNTAALALAITVLFASGALAIPAPVEGAATLFDILGEVQEGDFPYTIDHEADMGDDSEDQGGGDEQPGNDLSS